MSRRFLFFALTMIFLLDLKVIFAQSVECSIIALQKNVICYGAHRDGTDPADTTIAIQKAINDSSGGAVLFPSGTYAVSSSLILPSGTSLIANDTVLGSTKINGNFDGFLIDAHGSYKGPFLIRGISFTNNNPGSSVGSSGIINAQYTGQMKVEDCYLVFENTGILGGETISATIEDSFLTGDSGANAMQSRGFLGFARNSRFIGGRVYGCGVAFDIAGDSWNLIGVDAEWNGIAIRMGPSSGMICLGCHFETTGMLYTNAVSLPNLNESTWTDPGGQGIGWNGSITFQNCLIAFGSVGSANGTRAPLFVIKGQPSMIGKLTLIGNMFSSPLSTISQSFDPTVASSLVSGIRVVSIANSGLAAPSSIPQDSYTSYTNIN
jgi:Pectate lyase superfamily protein